MAHTFTGRKAAHGTKVSNTTNKLPGKPLPRFVYAHSPFNWTYDDELDTWLPKISKIPLIPGVNGCRNGPNGHVPALARLQAEGWTIIDETGPIMVTDPTTGELARENGYMVEYEAKRGSTFLDAWAVPEIIGGGQNAKLDWVTHYDHAGFKAWLVMLMEEGIIGPPQGSALNQVIRRQEKRAGRRIGESHDGNPHIQAHVAAEQSKLAKMKASIEATRPRPAPAALEAPTRPPPTPATTQAKTTPRKTRTPRGRKARVAKED